MSLAPLARTPEQAGQVKLFIPFISRFKKGHRRREGGGVARRRRARRTGPPRHVIGPSEPSLRSPRSPASRRPPRCDPPAASWSPRAPSPRYSRRQLPKSITLAMMREHFGQFGEGVDECVLKQKQVTRGPVGCPAGGGGPGGGCGGGVCSSAARHLSCTCPAPALHLRCPCAARAPALRSAPGGAMGGGDRGGVGRTWPGAWEVRAARVARAARGARARAGAGERGSGRASSSMFAGRLPPRVLAPGAPHPHPRCHLWQGHLSQNFGFVWAVNEATALRILMQPCATLPSYHP